MKHKLLGYFFALATAVLGVTTAHATNVVFDVSFNTAVLNTDSNFTAPFGIEFQMYSGGSAPGNTATLSNFNFGVGGSTSPSLSTVTLSVNPSNPYSDFNQGFTPGSTLSFQVDVTTNGSSASPDTFTFSFLQNYGTSQVDAIPTSAPHTTVLSEVMMDVQGTEAMLYHSGDGLLGGIFLPTPEPSSVTLFALGLGTLAFRRGWQNCRRVAANRSRR